MVTDVIFYCQLVRVEDLGEQGMIILLKYLRGGDGDAFILQCLKNFTANFRIKRG